MIDVLEKYAKIAKLYQTDKFYKGNQSVVISANDLLAIIERLQQAEHTVALLVLPSLPEQDLGDLLTEGYAAGKQVRKELKGSLRKKS